jgi:transcriptional regulator with XRE-family HTH domain
LYGEPNVEPTRTTGRSAPIDTIAVAVKRERERAGLSLSELAKRAGVAKSTLSQLEAGTGNPSIETLWALGVALDVPFSRLVDPRSAPMLVIRAGQGPAVGSNEATFVATLLSASPPGVRRDIYLISVEPGPARRAEAHLPGSVEHVVVSAGRLRAGPEDRLVDLDPGDYATFAGDVPHRYEALAPGTTAVLIMEHV